MMKNMDKKAFTLVEMIILVIILSIIALGALPMIGSASTMQVKAAANKIAADLEYAKSMAISRQKNYSIVFDINNETYQIQDSNGVIQDPMQTSKDFVVDFKKDSRICNVNVLSVNFDSAVAITFDYLGSPYSGTTSSNALINGSNGITLKAGNTQMEILVEPVTGYINIR